jgi:hypothetical protein
VPEAGNPQALNRYSYVLNRPLQGGDPTGHQNPVGGVLPPPTQPIDPVTLEQMAEALKQGVQSAGPYAPVVAGTAGVAAIVYVDIYYGGPMVADWAMQDVGPEYPLPYVAANPKTDRVAPTWVLPGTSTLRMEEAYGQGIGSSADAIAGTDSLSFADKQRQIERQVAKRHRIKAGLTQPNVVKSTGPPQGPPGHKPPRPPDDEKELWRFLGETIKNPDIPIQQKVFIISSVIVAAVTGNLN